MLLTGFLTSLAADGAVTVSGDVTEFDDTDREQAAQILCEMHRADASHLAGNAPGFDAAAALWAAGFLYRAIQCNYLRHLSDDAVLALLPDYEGDITPESIYSADIVLRHLPDLYRLALRKAPDDVLVSRLNALCARWPLSSIGTGITGTPAPCPAVIQHPSLIMLYADRVIAARDIARCHVPEVRLAVQKAIGGHEDVYWPGFSLQTQN